MKDAIAKRTRETREEALLGVFEQLMETAVGTFSEREATALRMANELVRRWTAAELERMAARYGDEVRVSGERYRRHASGVRRYHTLCGTIAVRRDSYRLVGVHNGPTVVPLELEAGIVENATPALAFSVGLDRTTVPMAELLDGACRARRRPYLRRPPPPITVAYRMAYVATVAVHDADGETLVSKRFSATADEGPDVLMEQLGAEVRHLLSARPELPLAIVQDGAPELWNLIDTWLARHQLTTAAKLIDRYHVDERLAQICEGLAAEGGRKTSMRSSEWRLRTTA